MRYVKQRQSIWRLESFYVSTESLARNSQTRFTGC